MLPRKTSRLFLNRKHFGDYSVVSVAIRCKFCVKGNRFFGDRKVQNWEIQPNLMPQGLLRVLPSLLKINFDILYGRRSR